MKSIFKFAAVVAFASMTMVACAPKNTTVEDSTDSNAVEQICEAADSIVDTIVATAEEVAAPAATPKKAAATPKKAATPAAPAATKTEEAAPATPDIQQGQEATRTTSVKRRGARN